MLSPLCFIFIRFHQFYLAQTLLDYKVFKENLCLVSRFSFFLQAFFAFLKQLYSFHLFLEHTQSFPKIKLGYIIFSNKNFSNFYFDYYNLANKNQNMFSTATSIDYLLYILTYNHNLFFVHYLHSFFIGNYFLNFNLYRMQFITQLIIFCLYILRQKAACYHQEAGRSTISFSL